MTFYILTYFYIFLLVFYKHCQLCVLIMRSFSKPGAVVSYVCRLCIIFSKPWADLCDSV